MCFFFFFFFFFFPVRMRHLFFTPLLPFFFSTRRCVFFFFFFLCVPSRRWVQCLTPLLPWFFSPGKVFHSYSLKHHALTDPSFSVIYGRIQCLAYPLIPLQNTTIILNVFSIILMTHPTPWLLVPDLIFTDLLVFQTSDGALMICQALFQSQGL